MRWLFAFVATVFVFAAQPAAAQNGSATSAAPAPSAGSFTPSHIEAARDALRAILVDTGALSAGSYQAFTMLLPQFRNEIMASPLYASLPADRQTALVAYINGFAPIAQEETLRGAPQVIDRFAPQMAALFAEADLINIAAFLRTPEGGAYFLRSVTDGVTSEASGQAVPTVPSSAEAAALAAFDQSPSGIVFNSRANELGVLMHQVGQASTGAPHISARLRRDMCAIIGDQCPPGWRGT